MALSKIKYKSFTFPHNPETTEFKCDRNYIKHKYPQIAGAELEDFGANAIIISGSGLFYGKDAYSDFEKLYSEFQKDGVGTVSHPVFTQITRGLMTSLEFRIDPEVNVITYSFEIVADTEVSVKEDLGKTKNTAVQTVTSSSETKKDYKVGDVVMFKGGTHYTNSGKSGKGSSARAGKAKITLGPDCKGNGKVHPWHLIHMDAKSNVYGWVDEGTFE